MYIEPKIESSYYCSNKGAHPSRNVLPYFYPKPNMGVNQTIRR